MRHRSRVGLAVLGLILGAGAALPALSTAPGNAADNATVTVVVTNLRNTHGMVQACLTAAPGHFPDCDRDPASHRLTVHAAASTVLQFTDVPPGNYAVAVLHDENGNGRVDKVLMVPREGFGFSRDAPVRFGPPTFADAVFAMGHDAQRQTIRMRYML